MNSSTAHNILDEINRLPKEEKDYLREKILKQLTEEKRKEILLRVKEAEVNYSSCKTKTGSADDLLKDLEND